MLKKTDTYKSYFLHCLNTKSARSLRARLFSHNSWPCIHCRKHSMVSARAHVRSLLKWLYSTFGEVGWNVERSDIDREKWRDGGCGFSEEELVLHCWLSINVTCVYTLLACWTTSWHLPLLFFNYSACRSVPKFKANFNYDPKNTLLIPVIFTLDVK